MVSMNCGLGIQTSDFKFLLQRNLLFQIHLYLLTLQFAYQIGETFAVGVFSVQGAFLPLQPFQFYQRELRM